MTPVIVARCHDCGRTLTVTPNADGTIPLAMGAGWTVIAAGSPPTSAPDEAGVERWLSPRWYCPDHRPVRMQGPSGVS